MAKKILDEKDLRISTDRIEKAWEILRKHPLIGPLVMRAKLKVIDYQPQVPAMFTLVSQSGDVFANPFNFPRTVGEWTFSLAHSLLHLAFGHFGQIRRGIVWNLACDCVVNEFLNRMRIGTQPEGMLRLPGGLPNDEEKLFAMWTHGQTPPKGGTTNGTAADMLAGANAKANWADIFARGIRRAAKQALSAAAGEDELSQAQQARAWFVKNYPLLGAVLQHLKIIENAKLCEKMNVRIAAYSPANRELIINPGWAMEDAEYRFVLAHFALHAGLQHAQRRRRRDAFVWNAACDYCVNGWLKKMPVLQAHCRAPAVGQLWDPQFDDKRPEAIYYALNENPKGALKLVTFAGEAVPDVLSAAQEEIAGREARGASRGDRLLLDAMLRGFQIQMESSKGAVPYSLAEELRALEHPALPWDVQLARWFDEHVPPLEKIRSYARPSRRQSATPSIARPRYVFPDEENRQRSTFGIVIDSSGQMEAGMLAQALNAIGAYALSRNIAQIRVVESGIELRDRGLIASEHVSDNIEIIPRKSAQLQPGVTALDNARDLPPEAPILLLTGTPCDRIACERTHAFVLPEGGRMPFKTSAPVIEIEDE